MLKSIKLQKTSEGLSAKTGWDAKLLAVGGSMTQLISIVLEAAFGWTLSQMDSR